MRFEISSTASQALQSEINRSVIFNSTRESSPVSLMEITRILHISAAVVNREGWKTLDSREVLPELIAGVRIFLDGYLTYRHRSFQELGLSAIGVGIPADVDGEGGRILSTSLYEE